MEFNKFPYALNDNKNNQKLVMLNSKNSKLQNTAEREHIIGNQKFQSNQLEELNQSSDQSNLMQYMCSGYDESNQSYSSENSWDQQTEYSNVKHSSQTQISSSIMNIQNMPQRNSVLTQKLSDKNYDKDYYCDQFKVINECKSNNNSQAISSLNSLSQPLKIIESLSDSTQEQKTKKEEGQQEVKKYEQQNENTSVEMQKLELDITKQENLKLISYSYLDFNTDNMKSQTLFCDIPFCLNNFVQEEEGDSSLQRICSYNKFKKVVGIKTFRNGMMMDCTLNSYSDCSFNQDYLISLLESKGNLALHNLAQSIQTYYNAISKITADAQSIIQSYDQDFLQRRVQASQVEKERILSTRDPRTNFYFKTYTINWENYGSPKVIQYGFSKGFCDIIGLSIQEKKQYILRKGFLECFSQNDKIKVMLKTCLSLPWNMRKEPIIIKTKQKFITYDNIIMNDAPVTIEFHNLSYDFDSTNNFKCMLSEFMIIGKVDLDQIQENRIKSQRINRERRQVDDKNNDEMNFYYSRESQSFLERYYKDIYGERYCLKKQLRRCEYVELNL